MVKSDQLGIAHIFLILVMTAIVCGAGYFTWQRIKNKSDNRTVESHRNFGAWEKRIAAAFEPRKCQRHPELKLYPGSYEGPLVDAHFHPASIPDGDINENQGNLKSEKLHTISGVNLTFDDVACTFKNDGTTPRNILSFFPVYRNIYKQQIEVTRRAVDKYPRLFVPFIMPPDDDGSPDGYPTVDAKTLDKMLSVEPGLFKGFGEIGMYARPGGAKALEPDSQRIRDIMLVLRKHGIRKIFMHLGEGQKESYKKLVRSNPHFTFIFHGDQLISQNPDGTQDLSQIDEILSNNPNVYYGIDELWGDVFILNDQGNKQKVLRYFEQDYEPLIKKDLANWEWFINKHQNRVMWDSDRGVFRYTLEPEVGRAIVRYVRAFIGRLDKKVQEKYAYKNAERAYTSQ